MELEEGQPPGRAARSCEEAAAWDEEAWTLTSTRGSVCTLLSRWSPVPQGQAVASQNLVAFSVPYECEMNVPPLSYTTVLPQTLQTLSLDRSLYP